VIMSSYKKSTEITDFSCLIFAEDINITGRVYEAICVFTCSVVGTSLKKRVLDGFFFSV